MSRETLCLGTLDSYYIHFDGIKSVVMSRGRFSLAILLTVQVLH